MPPTPTPSQSQVGSPTAMGTPYPSNWGSGPFGSSTVGGAAAQTTADVRNAPFNNQGEGPGGAGNPRNQAPQPAAAAGGGTSPGDYPNGPHGSSEWYGGLNDYGVQQALGSPAGFWGMYGQETQGWNPSGNAASFMANYYDPQTLAVAMNPTNVGPWGNEESLAAETGIANQLSGPNAHFFDVSQVMGGVLNAIATNDPNALMQVNPMLATLINENQGNPAGQINSIMQFFEQLLPSMMPADMAKAMIQQMTAAGNQWAFSLGKGDLKNLDVANFAQFILQTFGGVLGM